MRLPKWAPPASKLTAGFESSPGSAGVPLSLNPAVLNTLRPAAAIAACVPAWLVSPVKPVSVLENGAAA